MKELVKTTELAKQGKDTVDLPCLNLNLLVQLKANLKDSVRILEVKIELVPWSLVHIYHRDFFLHGKDLEQVIN